jgi:hypothetical protein
LQPNPCLALELMGAQVEPQQGHLLLLRLVGLLLQPPACLALMGV